ncbi:MAG: phosphatidate cytidylyltransferase [Vicingaceae bacterium]
MLTRAITGFLFILTIIAGIYFNQYISMALFTLIVILGIEEFYGLVKKSKTIKPIKFWGNLTGFLLMTILCLISLNIIALKFVFVPVIMIFTTFLIELYRKKDNPFINIAYTLLGMSYIVIPFAMLFHMGFYAKNNFNSSYSFQIILGFFIMLWTNDTGAYLAGRFLGKHKLFERISPKKTWEGSFGGATLTILAAYILSVYFTNLDLTNWIVIALLVAIFGGLGDLVESMLKRSLNIKDSGNILPGHGGILDRFDGLLISVPFIYSYLYLIS